MSSHPIERLSRAHLMYVALIVVALLPWCLGTWALGVVIALELGAGNALATVLGFLMVPTLGTVAYNLMRVLGDHERARP